MQRVVQIGHGLVGAVNGQRVLDEVVRAYREVVEIVQELLHHQRRGRHLDHRAQLHRAVGHAARVQLGTRQVNLGQRLADLAHMRQHRKQQLDRPMHCGAQHGT